MVVVGFLFKTQADPSLVVKSRLCLHQGCLRTVPDKCGFGEVSEALHVGGGGTALGARRGGEYRAEVVFPARPAVRRQQTCITLSSPVIQIQRQPQGRKASAVRDQTQAMENIYSNKFGWFGMEFRES